MRSIGYYKSGHILVSQPTRPEQLIKALKIKSEFNDLSKKDSLKHS